MIITLVMVMVMHLYSAFSIYVHIFKYALQHLVGDFARLLYGAVHNLFSATTSIHRCPQNRTSDARPQHRELNALLFTNSVWVL